MDNPTQPRSRRMADTPEAKVATPDRLWLWQIIEDGFIEEHWAKQPSVASYNRSIEYLAAAPLRAILDEMPADQRDIGFVVVDNDIWRRLCEIINGK